MGAPKFDFHTCVGLRAFYMGASARVAWATGLDACSVRVVLKRDRLASGRHRL